MAQSDLRLTGDVEPRKRNSPPEGRAARPAKPGNGSEFGDLILPDKPPSVKPEIIISGEGGALPTCVPPLRRALPPEGERMSFCNQMAAAIDGARTLTRLDHLSRSIWQGLTAGAVVDDDAQALAERLHARRSVLRGEIKPVGIPVGRPSIFPPRRLQRAPKRPFAIARRRHLAASGPMPPALACKFTVSELAVLRIIGDEVSQHGQCDRCVDEIAARAGVCRRMVQNALREGEHAKSWGAHEVGLGAGLTGKGWAGAEPGVAGEAGCGVAARRDD